MWLDYFLLILLLLKLTGRRCLLDDDCLFKIVLGIMAEPRGNCPVFSLVTGHITKPLIGGQFVTLPQTQEGSSVGARLWSGEDRRSERRSAGSPLGQHLGR